MSPEAQQRYVAEGDFKELPQIEESLVYLALASAKLGRESDARDAVLRLVTAERITPVYAELVIDRDRADFEAVAQKLVPGVRLTGSGTVLATDAAERTVMLRLIEERAAPQREEIERQAATRIAAAKKKADQDVAAEPAQPKPADGKYTVQLEIACEQSTVATAQRNGGSAVWVLPITYRGRSCQKILWGHFATAAEAQSAMSMMPAAIRSSTPGVVVRVP
jgi:septal ring-binding cell division protein DamX